jgi:hypothetical protein
MLEKRIHPHILHEKEEAKNPLEGVNKYEFGDNFEFESFCDWMSEKKNESLKVKRERNRKAYIVLALILQSSDVPIHKVANRLGIASSLSVRFGRLKLRDVGTVRESLIKTFANEEICNKFGVTQIMRDTLARVASRLSPTKVK